MSALGLAAGLLSAVVFGVAAVIQAHTVRRYASSPDRLVGFVARGVRDLQMIVVLVAYLVGFVLHAVAIWLLPLYLAQALVAMSLPVASLAAIRVDHSLSLGRWTAIAAVSLGLVLLALGSGEAGPPISTGRFAGILWVGVLLLAAASLHARRYAGAWLGLLAGLGYAGSAIAVRGVDLPLDAAVVWAALAIPSFGLVAFWLYSLGMRRSTVSTTTASLIVAQTFVPAAVGVALLGDGVRSGWWPAVIFGLLISTGGALALRTASTRGSEVALGW
ncbi:hypothetical protein [Nocardioides sp.]|uniref:hypothetical protein n=1 Tax=Nocardioides sp. TaxID=35761 RepID=UPI003562D801